MCLEEGCSTGKHLSLCLSRYNNLFHSFNNRNFYLSLYTSSDMSINYFCSADLLSIFLVPQFSLILSFFLHNSHSSAIHLWPCIFYCSLSTLPSFPSLFYLFVYLTKLYPFSPILLSFFFIPSTHIYSQSLVIYQSTCHCSPFFLCTAWPLIKIFPLFSAFSL